MLEILNSWDGNWERRMLELDPGMGVSTRMREDGRWTLGLWEIHVGSAGHCHAVDKASQKHGWEILLGKDASFRRSSISNFPLWNDALEAYQKGAESINQVTRLVTQWLCKALQG